MKGIFMRNKLIPKISDKKYNYKICKRFLHKKCNYKIRNRYQVGLWDKVFLKPSSNAKLIKMSNSRKIDKFWPAVPVIVRKREESGFILIYLDLSRSILIHLYSSGFIGISLDSSRVGSGLGLWWRGERSGAVAVGIVAAAPEFAALHRALFLHSFQHRFAAERAFRTSMRCRLHLSGRKSLVIHIFGKSPGVFKSLEARLYLGLQHLILLQ